MQQIEQERLTDMPVKIKKAPLAREPQALKHVTAEAVVAKKDVVATTPFFYPEFITRQPAESQSFVLGYN